MAQYNQSHRLSVICFLKEMTFKLVEQKIEENQQKVVVGAEEFLKITDVQREALLHRAKRNAIDSGFWFSVIMPVYPICNNSTFNETLFINLNWAVNAQ